MTQLPRTNFRSPYDNKFGFDLPSGLGEDVRNCARRTTDDDGRRKEDAVYTINPPGEPSAQVSLYSCFRNFF